MAQRDVRVDAGRPARGKVARTERGDDGRDADDFETLPRDPHRLTHDPRIAGKAAAPHAMAQHHDTRRGRPLLTVPFCTVPTASCRYSESMQMTSGTPLTAGGILKDGAALLALVVFIPFAILLVGTPVALVIMFLLWVGRMAAGAF